MGPITTDWTTKMNETYLSDTELAARYGVHRTTLRRWAKTDPAFPKAVSLSPGCTRWKLSAIVGWEMKRG